MRVYERFNEIKDRTKEAVNDVRLTCQDFSRSYELTGSFRYAWDSLKRNLRAPFTYARFIAGDEMVLDGRSEVGAGLIVDLANFCLVNLDEFRDIGRTEARTIRRRLKTD